MVVPPRQNLRLYARLPYNPSQSWYKPRNNVDDIPRNQRRQKPRKLYKKVSHLLQKNPIAVQGAHTFSNHV